MPTPLSTLNRRNFLGGAAAAALLGAAAAGCGSGDDGELTPPTGQSSSTSPPTPGPTVSSVTGSASASPSALPTYVPYAGVKPDLEPTASGVQAGYLNFPANRQKLHDSPPGKGGTATMMSEINQAAPPLLDKNRYWQELNKRAGVTLKMTMTPKYPEKLQVTLAGGDLPDLVELPYRAVPRLPDVLERRFVDLTEHLAGDRVAQYPGLANLSSGAWKGTLYGGKVWGIPLPRPGLGTMVCLRDDLRQAAGLSGDLATDTDFVELCRGLTDPKRNRWALGTPLNALSLAMEMYRVPSAWEEADGAFTADYEAEGMRRALDLFARLWKEGLIHPDSFATSSSSQNSWFTAGTIAVRAATPGFWTNVKTGVIGDIDGADVQVAALPLLGADGQPGRKILGPELHSMASINKEQADRVNELLTLIDWLASPFGTEENLFIDYGVEGYHYTWADDGPKLTKQGQAEVPTTRPQYIAHIPPILYVPGFPDDTKAQHDYEHSVMPGGATDPTIGLFSDTDLTKGATLRKTMSDLQSDVIQGRKSLADWDNAVKQWQKNGGDTIRSEYQKSFAEQAATTGG